MPQAESVNRFSMKNVDRVGELLLPEPNFWYLASPYTRYVAGIENAYALVRDISECLHQDGIPHYAPIVATHEWAMIAGIDPLDEDMWAAIDQPWMERAHGIVVLKMRGWDESKGIAKEIEWFTKANREVFGLEPTLILPQEF